MFLAILAIISFILSFIYFSPVLFVIGIISYCFHLGHPRETIFRFLPKNIRGKFESVSLSKYNKFSAMKNVENDNKVNSKDFSFVNGDVTMTTPNKAVSRNSPTVQHGLFNHSSRGRTTYFHASNRSISSKPLSSFNFTSDIENTPSPYRRNLRPVTDSNEIMLFQPKYSSCGHLPTIRLDKPASYLSKPSTNKGLVTVKIATSSSPPSGLSTIQKLTSSFGPESPIHEQRNNLINALRKNSRKRDNPDTNDENVESLKKSMKRQRKEPSTSSIPSKELPSPNNASVKRADKRSAPVETPPSALEVAKRSKNNSVLSSYSSAKSKINYADDLNLENRKRKKIAHSDEISTTKQELPQNNKSESELTADKVHNETESIEKSSIIEDTPSSSRPGTPNIGFESKNNKRNRLLNISNEKSPSLIYTPTLRDQKKDEEKNVQRLNRMLSKFKAVNSGSGTQDEPPSNPNEASNDAVPSLAKLPVTASFSTPYSLPAFSAPSPAITSTTLALDINKKVSLPAEITISSTNLVTTTSIAPHPISSAVSSAKATTDTSSLSSLPAYPSASQSIAPKPSISVAGDKPAVIAPIPFTLSPEVTISKSAETKKDVISIPSFTPAKVLPTLPQISNPLQFNSPVSSQLTSSAQKPNFQFGTVTTTAGSISQVTIPTASVNISSIQPTKTGPTGGGFHFNPKPHNVTTLANSTSIFGTGASTSSVTSTQPQNFTPTSAFKFGSTTASSTASQVQPQNTNSSSAFKLGATTISSTNTSTAFGAQVNPQNATNTSAFSFGSKATPSANTSAIGAQVQPQNTAFSFGSNATSSDNNSAFGAPVQPQSSTPFSFGSTAAPTNTSAFGTQAQPQNATATSLSFGSTAAPVTSAFGAQTQPQNAGASPSFKFGSHATPTVNNSVVAGFGNQLPTSGFGFGGAAPNTTVSPFNTKPNISSNNIPMFASGSAPGQTQQSSAGDFKFGSSNNTASTGPKGGFKFDAAPSTMNNNNSMSSSSVQNQSQPFQFGANPASKRSETASPFAFGSPAAPQNPEATKPFQFGSSKSLNSGFQFGASNNSSTPVNGAQTAAPSAFQFGSSTTSNPPASNVFGFGQNASQPQQPPGVFQFGGNPNNSQAAASPFQTGITNSMQFGSNSTSGINGFSSFPQPSFQPAQSAFPNGNVANSFTPSGPAMFTTGSTNAAPQPRRMLSGRRHRS